MNLLLRGNGAGAWPGWPTAPKLEELRAAWFEAPDVPSQQAIAAQIQEQALIDLPYIPLGQFFQPTAYRRGLTGMVPGPTVFWGIRRG